eukprot:Rmarinus@m.29643
MFEALCQNAPAAHTPGVPWIAPAGYWAVLMHEFKDRRAVVLNAQHKPLVHKTNIKIPVRLPPTKGEVYLTLLLKSDCYLGFDYKYVIKMFVTKDQEVTDMSPQPEPSAPGGVDEDDEENLDDLSDSDGEGED